MNSQMLRHGVIKMRILKALLKQLPEQFDASNEITVQLSDTTLVDPDVLVTSKLDADIRYVRRDELFLAIEVAHTSIAYDLGVKAQNYAHAAIQELWVVDVNNELTWVHRLPSETGYRSVISVEFDEPLTPLISDDVKIVIGSL